MKQCCSCKTDDESKKYFVVRQSENKTYYRCSECERKKRQKTHSKNPNKYLVAGRERNKKWYKINKRTKLIQNKEWFAANPNYSRDYHREYERNKRKDPSYRLHQAVSIGLRHCLKHTKKGRKWESLVGYTREELKSHLEKQFQPGMTWDNYGEWHVDHIIPVSHFNIQTSDCPDFKKCWSLDNLQPLWEHDNCVKGNRFVG